MVKKYNDVKVDVSGGDLAATSLDELGRNLVNNMHMMDILVALSNGLEVKYGEGQDAPTEAMQANKELIDLMYHADGTAGAAGAEQPDHGPFTLMRRMWLEGLMDVKEVKALKENFNAQVEAAGAPALTEAQIEAVYQVLRSYNLMAELQKLREKTGVKGPVLDPQR